jgi:anion-transporting  ArsA/GET3 family ATPase
LKQHSPAADTPERSRYGGQRGHRIVFVTGKGGVGKSVVAAATALQFARQGHNVLLAEMGSRSFYGPLLGLPVGVEAVAWQPNIGIARWDVESTLREYISHYLPIKALTDRILGNTVMKALVAAAPSLSELAMLGKLTAPMRHTWYKREVDVVVVDAYATGQFMALLRAPRGMAQTASSGPMHKHSSIMAKLLADPAICEYRLVTLAEEMPVSEACEMAADLHAEVGIAPRIYCNRLLELPPDIPVLHSRDPAHDFVAQMRRIDSRQQRSLQALEQLGALRAGPVQHLPLIPEVDARTLLERLADALQAGEGAAR